MQGRLANPGHSLGHWPHQHLAASKGCCNPASAQRTQHVVMAVATSHQVNEAGQTGAHPGAQRDKPAKGLDFKYTTVAFKVGESSGSKKMYRGSSRAVRGRPRRSGGPGHPISQAALADGTATYRAFEAMEGSRLPLLLLDGADLPVLEELQPLHDVEAATTQPGHPPEFAARRRTHRRADMNVVHRPSQSAVTTGLSPLQAPHAVGAAVTIHSQPQHEVAVSQVATILPPAPDVTHTEVKKQPIQLQSQEEAPSRTVQEVSAHFRACAKILRTTPGRLNELHELQVVLLQLTSSQALSSHLQQTAQLLQLPLRQVQQLIKRHPDLLLTPVEHLQERHEQLQQLFNAAGLVTKRRRLHHILRATPQLLTTLHTPEAAMLGLARCLQPSLGMQGVVQMLHSHPLLLTHPLAPTGRQFTDVLDCLAAQLELSVTQVATSLVQHVPEVLLRSPGAVRECLRYLALQWQLQPADLVQVVTAQPAVLLMSPGDAEAHCARVKALLSYSQHWKPDLHRLPVKLTALAKVLAMEYIRFDRLQYLVDTRRDGGIHWYTALNMSQEDWDDMYPAFYNWWTRDNR